jgi:hypothetical protein
LPHFTKNNFSLTNSLITHTKNVLLAMPQNSISDPKVQTPPNSATFALLLPCAPTTLLYNRQNDIWFFTQSAPGETNCFAFWRTYNDFDANRKQKMQQFRRLKIKNNQGTCKRKCTLTVLEGI